MEGAYESVERQAKDHPVENVESDESEHCPVADRHFERFSPQNPIPDAYEKGEYPGVERDEQKYESEKQVGAVSLHGRTVERQRRHQHCEDGSRERSDQFEPEGEAEPSRAHALSLVIVQPAQKEEDLPWKVLAELRIEPS